MYIRRIHWELWDTETSNLIGWRESEAEAVALVRELVGKGWPTEVLSLMVEDEALPVKVLPAAMMGSKRFRHAGSSRPTARLSRVGSRLRLGGAAR